MAIKLENYFRIIYGTTTQPARPLSQAIPEAIDANGDGIQDILLFGAYYPFNGNNPAGQASTLLIGKGDGTFSLSAAGFPVLNTLHPREVVQADFNGDGKPDMFVATHGYDTSPYPGEQNRLILSGPNGYTDASANLPQLSDFSHSAAVGDVNGDGKLDIFVGNLSSPVSAVEPYVLLGDGTGKFTRSDAGLPVNGGLLDRRTGNFGMTASVLADLNGDGKPDLVLGNDGNPYNKEHRSLVYWNTGSGFAADKLSFLPQGWFGDGRIVHDIVAEDFDGDGDRDLMLMTSEALPTDAYADGWAIDMLRNDNGSFVADTTDHFAAADSHEGLPNTNSGIGAGEFLRVMDVNGDGTRDLVVNQFMNNPVTGDTPVVWTNDGFGHFEVALRAGQMMSFSNDSYMFGVFNIVQPTANGIDFTKLSINGDVVYQITAQAIKPLPGNVAIKATARNDLITQNSNNNTIDGGAGRDTLGYKGAAANYTVSQSNGKFTVTDKTGADGVDVLTAVERIVFSDGGLALDIDGMAGKAYRLYRAAFDRPSDKGGLGYWISVLDQGVSLETVASGFISSSEFKALYGANPSNGDVLTALYKNVLHRAPDQGGYDFWMKALNAGVHLEDMLVSFSESNENQLQVVGQIQNGIEYLPLG